ncbi:MAG: hypothetical protein AAF570_06220 [Bacteroidota bacterium]
MIKHFALTLLLSFLLIGCGNETKTTEKNTPTPTKTPDSPGKPADKATAADPTPPAKPFVLADFEKYLESQEVNKGCEVLIKSIAELKLRLRDAQKTGDPIADEAIDKIDAFSWRVAEGNTGDLPNLPFEHPLHLAVWNPDKKEMPAEEQAKVDAWKDCGLVLATAEGMLFLEPSPDLLVTHFQGYGSEALQVYLKQRKKEMEKGFAADAGIIIPMQDVAERAVWWSKFVEKFPDFKLIKNAKINAVDYTGYLMTGLDNTPAHDWGGTEKLYPEFEKAMNWVIENEAETFTGKAIAGYLETYKAEGKVGKKTRGYSQEWFESQRPE